MNTSVVGLTESFSRAMGDLDLSRVKKKLMSPGPEGKAWSAEYAAEAEKWYRRFLTLLHKYPTLKHAPNFIIDEFWHQHIVDTVAYAKDCDALFGRFINHNPYFGTNGDAAERDQCFACTMDLLEQEFGEDPRQFGPNALECSVDCGWVDPAVPVEEEEHLPV